MVNRCGRGSSPVMRVIGFVLVGIGVAILVWALPFWFFLALIGALIALFGLALIKIG